MPMLNITCQTTVVAFTAFADDEDNNFEGDSTVELTVTLTPTIGRPVLVKEAFEWWCGDGGWVTALHRQAAASPWGMNPTVPATGSNAVWTLDIDQPVQHVIFIALVSDPSGTLPDEWIATQTTVAIDSNTQFVGTIEARPDVISLPPLPLPIVAAPGLVAPLASAFIAVRAPVDVFDMVLPVDGGLIRKRMLVIAGQIVNWLADPSLKAALFQPASSTEAMNFRMTVEDHVAGTTVISESFLNPDPRYWRGNLGMGDDAGFKKDFDDQVAAFLIHRALPETFSFGTLILEFIWSGGTVKRSVPIQTVAVDVLRWPVKLGDDQRLQFSNGLSPKFNSHTGNLHQHLAYDISVVTGNGSAATFGASICALAGGRLKGFHDSEPDRAPGVRGDGPANRIFVEHDHAEAPRYSVCAHIEKGTASRSATVAAGTGIANIGNNGSGSGEHLHLAYYRLNRFGRMQMLPMAFAMRSDASSETLVGVPGHGVKAIPALPVPVEDEIVDKLEVHLTTSNQPFAGTDADISVKLGGRIFNLDDPRRDDFERGSTDQFQITPWPGLRKSMLRGEIRLHKSPDGPLGGWRLDGVKVVVNGVNMFDRQGINIVLSSAPQVDNLDWTDTIP